MMRAQDNQGFTLLEIMIVVAVIGLLAAIAVPAFAKARDTSQEKVCVSNLRQIHSAKEQWAMAALKGDGADVILDDVNEYIKGGTIPNCPSGGTYTYQIIGVDPVCSQVAEGHILP